MAHLSRIVADEVFLDREHERLELQPLNLGAIEVETEAAVSGLAERQRGIVRQIAADLLQLGEIFQPRTQCQQDRLHGGAGDKG